LRYKTHDANRHGNITTLRLSLVAGGESRRRVGAVIRWFIKADKLLNTHTYTLTFFLSEPQTILMMIIILAASGRVSIAEGMAQRWDFVFLNRFLFT
jgi:hypothetical protein